MSVFCFVDEITELKKNQSVTAFYTLKGDEEFLEDHFGGFPVMPGVLLLEALKQAAAAVLSKQRPAPYRLALVEGVRFGQFVKPGDRLRIAARFLRREKDLDFFAGRIDVVDGSGSVRAKALTADMALAVAR